MDVKQPPRSLQRVPIPYWEHEMRQPEDHQFHRPAQGLYGVGVGPQDGRGDGHHDADGDGECLDC